jgi:hypothetical protein
MAKEHWITYELHEEGLSGRVRARYSSLEEAKTQAQHDVDVNNRVDVKVEDAGNKIVWSPKESLKQ